MCGSGYSFGHVTPPILPSDGTKETVLAVCAQMRVPWFGGAAFWMDFPAAQRDLECRFFGGKAGVYFVADRGRVVIMAGDFEGNLMNVPDF